MTVQERRDEVKRILMTLPTSDSGNYYRDDLVSAFSYAFQAVRREVWEEAATYADSEHHTSDDPEKDLILTFPALAKWCRAKAKEER